MQHDLTVSFGPDQAFRFTADSSMSSEAARRWLDEQFLELDCEPIRASGKVLVADKLLAIADAAGAAMFADDAAWAQEYAQAAGAATARAVVRVDVPGGTVSF